MIARDIEKLIQKRLNDTKVIILFGPRQAGKTTLLKHLVSGLNDVLWWNGDETDIREKLRNPTSTLLKSLVGNSRYLIIDEAQRIENIGLCLKLIHDNIPQIKVIATGSSAFELANRINEPLTGRKWEYFLYPLSFAEMAGDKGELEEERLLQHRLIYGYYPEVINKPGEEWPVLQQLSDSFLYRDILTWEQIKKPDRIEVLMQALALQLGNEVSYLELSRFTGIDKETVERYIMLLEKAFVIFRLRSFSRNLRTELRKSRKIYFCDNGLRNAIIRNFNPLALRNDTGPLWENFLISERIKYLQVNQMFTNRFFWRTQGQKEIDYIEEYGGILHAYEFKWNNTKATRLPLSFGTAYPDHSWKIITQENYKEFIYYPPVD